MNNPMILASVKEDFYLNFIKDDRYLWLLDGLKTTLIITVFAVIVGLIIGFLVAIIRSAHDKSGSFKILNLQSIPDRDPWNTDHDPVTDHELCNFWFCEH